MAVTTLTPVKGDLNKFTEFAFGAATTAADGFEFTMPKNTEEYVVVLVYNSDASNSYDITIKKPTNGNYAAASSDEVHELGAGEFAQLRIESARYADNKGKVKLVPENAAVKVQVIY